MKSDFKTVDEYISSFPKSTQKMLEQIRLIIKKNCTGSGTKY